MRAINNTDKNKKLFSQNLKYYMNINNKSRSNLSHDLNISYTTICDWVNGKVIPRSKKIEPIAKYFGIDVSDLYSYHDDINFGIEKDKELLKNIEKFTDNKYQKELLIKCTMLNLDNTKKMIEHTDYYLYKQGKEEEEFKYLDNYNDKSYDK